MSRSASSRAGSTASSTPKERRVVKRSQLRLRADVTLPGDLTIVAHTIDISTGGVSFDVPFALQTSQTCIVDFDLKKYGGRRFEMVAIVRNCRSNQKGRFDAGLEFQTPPAELAAFLTRVLL